MPVDKTVDDKAYVGTINENGVLEILLKNRKDTTLGKIIKTVSGQRTRDVQKRLTNLLNISRQ